MITNAHVVCTDAAYEDYALELERGDPRFAVRVHTLTEVARNARRWRNGYKSPPSKSLEWGSLLDARVLQPATFKSRYAVPPANYLNKEGKTCRWRDDDRIEAVRVWKEQHAGTEMLKVEEANNVERAYEVMRRDEKIAALLDSGPSQVWVAGEWQDKKTGLTVPIKCLIDKVPDPSDPIYGKCIADLKTTANASPRRFARDCHDYHYAVQAAFYLDLFTAATGQDKTDFVHIIQESFDPYELRSPPPILAARWVEAGRWEYQRMLAYYCACLSANHWPGYDHGDGWPVTEPEEWMLLQSLPTLDEAEVTAEPELDDIIP